MSHADDLYTVSTILEIARVWHKNPVTVRRAIDSKRNPLEARKSGGVWLVSVESVKRRWGNPPQPIAEMH